MDFRKIVRIVVLLCLPLSAQAAASAVDGVKLLKIANSSTHPPCLEDARRLNTLVNVLNCSFKPITSGIYVVSVNAVSWPGDQTHGNEFHLDIGLGLTPFQASQPLPPVLPCDNWKTTWSYTYNLKGAVGCVAYLNANQSYYIKATVGAGPGDIRSGMMPANLQATLLSTGQGKNCVTIQDTGRIICALRPAQDALYKFSETQVLRQPSHPAGAFNAHVYVGAVDKSSMLQQSNLEQCGDPPGGTTEGNDNTLTISQTCELKAALLSGKDYLYLWAPVMNDLFPTKIGDVEVSTARPPQPNDPGAATTQAGSAASATR